MSATRFLVSGRVQGVGYRLFAVRAARGLGITGFARNLDNGQVEVVGQGSEEDLRRFEAPSGRGRAADGWKRSNRRTRPSTPVCRGSRSGTEFRKAPMDLRTYIRDVPDFPKKGIVFKDITPLLSDRD